MQLAIHTNSLNPKALESECGEAPTEQHCHHDNAQSGGEDELSLLVLGVAYCQGKGNGPAQSGKHQHVLETEADLLGPPKVQEERDHVDIDQSASKDGHLYYTVKGNRVGSFHRGA